MEVLVRIETQGSPTTPRLDALRSAAARLTDDKASIRVTHEPTPDRHCLVTRFTMRTMAQYKVVGEIYAAFKMAIWDFTDFQDISIAFPKPASRPRRRGRKPPPGPCGSTEVA